MTCANPLIFALSISMSGNKHNRKVLVIPVRLLQHFSDSSTSTEDDEHHNNMVSKKPVLSQVLRRKSSHKCVAALNFSPRNDLAKTVKTSRKDCALVSALKENTIAKRYNKNTKLQEKHRNMKENFALLVEEKNQ